MPIRPAWAVGVACPELLGASAEALEEAEDAIVEMIAGALTRLIDAVEVTTTVVGGVLQ